MPNNNETTTKFKVDISELKSAMQEAKRSIAVTNSEFKAVSSSMDDWTKSTDGLSAKLRQLDSNLNSQKTILRNLEEQYELTVREMGEGSKAADDLKIKINNQRAAINNTERDISQYQGRLEEVAEAERIAAETGRTVDEVLRDVAESAEEAGESAENAGDGFTVFKGAVANFVGNVLTGLANGLKDAATNLLGLGEATREYRDQMNKLASASTDAGYTVDYAKEKYKELYGVLGDETASNTAVSNFMALGTSEENLNSLLNSAIGIWAKYGDSIPLDGLAESINETAKVGQVTGNLADALNWAGISEDEFNERLSKCSTEQQRQRVIADTLNETYGDLSASYQESNKSIIDANKAQADYTDTMAALGEKVEPVTTTLKEGVNSLLQEFLKLVEDVDIEVFTSKIQEGFKVLINDVIPAVKEGLGWIIDNKDILIAGLAGIAAGFTAFKVAPLIMGAVKALKSMTVASALAAVQTKLLAAKTWLLNTALLANPIAAVVALIVGLVAAFVVLWNKCDWFRNFWIGLWEDIKTLCGTAIDAIAVFFTETVPEALDKMIEFLSQLPSKVWTWLLNTINKVNTWRTNMVNKAKEAGTNFVKKIVEYVSKLPSKVWTWLLNTINKVNTWRTNMTNRAKEAASSFINKVIEYIKQLPSKVWTWLLNTANKINDWKNNLVKKGKEAAKGLVNSIVNTVKELPSKMKSIGSDLVKGLWNGISDVGEWLKNKISGFVGDVTSWLKDFFGINSPSKLMADEVGKWLPQGIAVGIDKNAKSAIKSMRNLAVNTVGAAKAGLDTTVAATGGIVRGGGVVNNYNQVINSPKPVNRLELYRQTKNLLGYNGSNGGGVWATH